MARKDPAADKAYKHAWYLQNKVRIAAKEQERLQNEGDFIREKSRQYYAVNREKILTQDKARQAKDPERKRARRRESYYRHREAISARRRQKHQENPDKNRKASRESYKRHRAKRIQYQKTYNGFPDNKAKVLARQQRYNKANQDIIKAAQQRHRALKKRSPRNDFTAKQWAEVKAHYGHRCVYCGRQMHRLTMDHITPLSKGGAHTLSNIVPACASCNARKHAGAPLVPVQPLLL